MDRYFCKQISSFWLDNRDVQGRNEVRWRLGQEASLALPRSNLRPFGSKCTVLMKVLMTLWLFGPPQWFGTRGIVPPCPLSLRLWWCAIKFGKIPKIINVSIPNVMTFYSMNICNFQYGIGLAQTANKGYWRHFGLLHVFFVISMPVPRVSSALTCVCFANNKTFPTLNKLLFEG